MPRGNGPSRGLRPGWMSVEGHQRHFERARATSALAPEADILLQGNICRAGPTGDMATNLHATCETRITDENPGTLAGGFCCLIRP